MPCAILTRSQHVTLGGEHTHVCWCWLCKSGLHAAAFVKRDPATLTARARCVQVIPLPGPLRNRACLELNFPLWSKHRPHDVTTGLQIGFTM